MTPLTFKLETMQRKSRRNVAACIQPTILIVHHRNARSRSRPQHPRASTPLAIVEMKLPPNLFQKCRRFIVLTARIGDAPGMAH
jgi:hypothetical protein